MGMVLTLLFVALAIVYLWRRLPGRGEEVAKLRGNGRFSVDVVGESFHREALRRLFPPGEEDEDHDAVAMLLLEDHNPHDDKAVAVEIRGQKVGHLSRKMAREFRQAIARDGHTRWRRFAVDAQVYVPADEDAHYSVTLDIPEES